MVKSDSLGTGRRLLPASDTDGLRPQIYINAGAVSC